MHDTDIVLDILSMTLFACMLYVINCSKMLTFCLTDLVCLDVICYLVQDADIVV